MHSTYGLATKVTAHQGRHADLIGVLADVSREVFNVPGCTSYVVSTVLSQPDDVFIVEFWASRDHQRSAFAMAGIFELANQFHTLAAHIEQHELVPLTN
ncbi:MAG TPA: antibiotic biosynthesis monooxygenase [Pseudoxanthomonas sp.]|nr:antibiotic biosynthesis monooxygenase [Pseudoxanthomonas sp.]